MEELFLIDSGIPSRLVANEPQTNGNAVLSTDQPEVLKPDHPLNVIEGKQGDNSGTGAMTSSMKNSPSKLSVSSESRKKEAGPVINVAAGQSFLVCSIVMHFYP